MTPDQIAAGDTGFSAAWAAASLKLVGAEDVVEGLDARFSAAWAAASLKQPGRPDCDAGACRVFRGMGRGLIEAG